MPTGWETPRSALRYSSARPARVPTASADTCSTETRLPERTPQRSPCSRAAGPTRPTASERACLSYPVVVDDRHSDHGAHLEETRACARPDALGQGCRRVLDVAARRPLHDR